jgi:DNA-binding CsgD family transcriptional regulator
MHRYSEKPHGPIFKRGFEVFRNVAVDGKTVDAVMIDDGEKLTTVLYDRAELIEKQLEVLKPFRLSKSEQVIAEKYLQGFSNADIAEQLFISRATLRTHLNNIYKKLPSDLKAEILQSHRNTEIRKPKRKRS